MQPNVAYVTLDGIDADELLEFYKRQNHPISGDRAKLDRMVKNTFCFVGARQGGELIGIARGVTDGIRGVLVECKLDPRFQGPACITRTDGRIEHDQHGIAREMALRVITSLHAYGCERITAMAYGTEVDFCEELGFKKTSGTVAMHLDRQMAAPLGDNVGSA
jgi:hypothetical protein